MPSRPPRVCSGCREVVPPGPCPGCTPRGRQETDRVRGSSHRRGYGRLHRGRFRPAVLARDPVCTCGQTCRTPHGQLLHEAGDCDELSTVADHYPLTKRELRARGLDDNDPDRGRGLCKGCHDRHTARSSPGGWAKG
jgi:5-methylcytosine-specific restriction protein A